MDLRSPTVPPSKNRSSSDGARTNSRNPRSPSVNRNGARVNSKGSRGNSVDKQHLQRRQSKSPRRDNQQKQRGRSTEKYSPSYAAEVEMDPALECLQYYTRYSTSPNQIRKQSVPGIFRRPLTPKSKSHLQTTYFYSTSGDTKFKDVRTKGFCLRCYGSDHLANACQRYTRPCPVPCRNCMHLFHPTEQCKFYNSSGKSRPSSRSGSSSREK